MKEEFSDVAMRDRWRRIARRLRGSSVLDIGCSYGDGADFVPEGMSYEGIDIDKSGGRLPKEVWPRRAAPNRTFRVADFRQYVLGRHWDTIVVLEVLEHYEDGRGWAQRLKAFCNRLIISVPENRRGAGEERNGHVLQGLTIEDFPGFH